VAVRARIEVRVTAIQDSGVHAGRRNPARAGQAPEPLCFVQVLALADALEGSGGQGGAGRGVAGLAACVRVLGTG